MKQFYHDILSACVMLLPLSAMAAEPLPPSEVSAVSTSEGVVISWLPVTEDVDENQLDPETVAYDVFRCDASDNKENIAEDIRVTTCTDVLGEITGEVYYRWQVIAKTSDGSSSASEGYSPQLSFGDGVALPYLETFNTPDGWSLEPDNFWLAEHTAGWDDFKVEKEIFFSFNGDYIYIHGADYTESNEDGCLYFEPSKWTQSDVTFTSGDIDLRNAANPLLAYMYYSFPGAHNKYQVSIVDGDGSVHELVNAVPDGTDIGWKKIEIGLTEFKGGKVKIRFSTSYDPDNAPDSGVRVPICIDNVSVTDKTPSGFDDVVADDDNARVVYFSIDGRKVDNPSYGQFVIKVSHHADGTVSASKLIVR